MPRSVVCISRALGAGGEEVGRLVAERLGFLYVDEEIIARAAERGGIDPEQAADAERRNSMFAGLLDYLAAGGTALATTPISPEWNEQSSETIRGFIRDAVREVATRGDAVIVAHAASHAIGAQANALRVLVTAPEETRVQRLEAAGDERALKTVRRSDSQRADYLKRFYDVGQELPTHYDLVINTDTLSGDLAAALIAQAATGGPAA